MSRGSRPAERADREPGVSRRGALQLGFGLAGLLWSAGATDREQAKDLLDDVDHVLLGASDLEQGIAWLERRTGVRAVPGGSHPGKGTRNALAALGGQRYLEVIAPDPAQGPPSRGGAAELARLTEPRLVTWAAKTADAPALAARARRFGVATGEPTPGSRQRPDGSTLRWTTLGVADSFDGVAPFFIEWSAGVLHPSQDAPTGLKLVALRLAHPRARQLEAALLALGIVADVAQQAAPALSLRLDTPKGRVQI